MSRNGGDSGAHDSLSGTWSGVYDYPAGKGEATPFNALLLDVAGWVSGETVEPNLFADHPAMMLRAMLDGKREGRRVSFTKTYDGGAGQSHSVLYEGECDAGLTRIEGVWRIESLFGGLRGPFVMTRSNWEVDEESEAEAVMAAFLEASGGQDR